MKLTRAIRLLALAMTIVAALAVPSLASAANWKENGTEITDFGPHWLKNGGSLTKSANLILTGNYNFTSAIGGINCSAGAGATINPGASGSLNELALWGCTTTGGISKCTVTSATSSGVPAFTASAGGVVKIVGANSTYKLTGGVICPKELTLSGTVTATPDNSAKISNLTLSGLLPISAEGKPTGSNATMSGTLAPISAGTYGVGSAPTVALAGSIKGTIEVGSYVGCETVNGSLSLAPGGAGQITTLTWASCYINGGWAITCGNVISATSNGLPWAVQDEGTEIKLSVSFTVKMEKCTWDVSGTMMGKPDNTGAISNFKPWGILNVKESGSELGWLLWNSEPSGFSWTPAGWYGL